jgi:DNA-binding CsgD family transcriptional regulator
MTQLSRADLQGAVGVIYAAHEFDDLPSFRSGLLPHLRDLIRCDIAGYNEQDPRTGWFVIDDPPGSVLENAGELLDVWAYQHPVITKVREGDMRAHKLSDFLTRREFHSLELYHEVYRPIGAEDQISCGVPAASVIGIAFNRGTDFTERDRAVLSLLQPHLAQAYAAVAAREKARAVIDTFERELDERGAAVVLVESSRRIAHASPRAFELLDTWFGRGARSGALPRRLSEWLVTARDKFAPPMTLSDERGKVVVRVVAGVAEDPYELLVIEEKRAQGPSAESLRATFGLTKRQSEVLALAARGLCDADIANELSISPATVRKHMENVHVILGVHTRSAAVVRALGG